MVLGDPSEKAVQSPRGCDPQLERHWPLFDVILAEGFPKEKQLSNPLTPLWQSSHWNSGAALFWYVHSVHILDWFGPLLLLEVGPFCLSLSASGKCLDEKLPLLFSILGFSCCTHWYVEGSDIRHVSCEFRFGPRVLIFLCCVWPTDEGTKLTQRCCHCPLVLQRRTTLCWGPASLVLILPTLCFCLPPWMREICKALCPGSLWVLWILGEAHM